MKRSRTCMNLVELDAPTAPKRTCSLPNLAWNGGRTASSSSLIPPSHRDTLLFFQQHAASALLSRGAAVPTPPAVAAAEGSFVVESVVRSKGSLNEITIVEGQQFIGEESSSSGGETAAPEVPQCSAAGGSPVCLFGGAVHGSLFEDGGGDSSDYFCGVASSDEAEENSNDAGGAGAATATATATAAVVGDGACFARQISDADSTTSTSCSRQISDASSSGDGIVGYAYAFEEGGGEGEADVVVGTSADCLAHGTAACVAPTSLSLPTLAAGPHAGGTWRPRTTGSPRFKVTICSPRTGGGSGSGSRQRSMTVPPPWPPTVVPRSAVMNGWRGNPATTRPGKQQQQQQQEERRRRRLRYLAGDDEDTEDGSLVSALGPGFSLSDDAKMLLGMDRLRLLDPESASY